LKSCDENTGDEDLNNSNGVEDKNEENAYEAPSQT
jgi:hypothetical protein